MKLFLKSISVTDFCQVKIEKGSRKKGKMEDNQVGEKKATGDYKL